MSSKYLIFERLKIAFTSLSVAGIFSIILVLLRMPIINSLLPQNIFKKSLAAHVNLAILFWILSMGTVYFSYNIKKNLFWLESFLNKLAWVSVFLISLSVFTKSGESLMVNYLPVIQNLPFFLGITLFASVILISSIFVIISTEWQKLIQLEIKYWANLTIAITIIIGFLGFYLSGVKLAHYIKFQKIEIDQFYEWLFWGGGHLLQFAFVQIMCFALVMNLKETIIIKEELYIFFFAVNILFQSIGLIGFKYQIDDPNYYQYFTYHMKYFAAIMPSSFIFLLLFQLIKKEKMLIFKIPNIFITCSVILFFLGNLISLKIKGSNVVIPAHYHGSTVGVTIAAMGLLVLISEKYSQQKINKKLLFSQILCYSIGQIIHIIGLNWSGGYGVLRKMPGQILSAKAKISMGFMGMGGLLAIIGGAIFTFMMMKLVYFSKISEEQENL